MSINVNGVITWIRTFLDDVYELKGQGGNLSTDKIYPVGAIYMSVNNTSPASLFGGTWVQLTDTFLYASASADSNATTSTNGSKDAVVVKHTHTQNAHTHIQNAHTHIQNSHTHTQNEHVHDAPSGAFVASNQSISTGSTKRVATSNTSGNYYWQSSSVPTITRHSNTEVATATNQNTTATNQNTTATNQETGVDGTDKNMPPYMKVYMWKRTA